jgi:SAM-dependent methyltransferase
MMDEQTLSFYRKNAAELSQRYEEIASPICEILNGLFPEKARILDIGCGSGRDLAMLERWGHDVYGVDACPEFVTLAQKLHPALSGRILEARLPDMETPFGGHFDGVLCSAVLMHLHPCDLPATAAILRKCVRTGGKVLVSVTSQRTDIDSSGRDSQGRLFSIYDSEELQRLLERAKLRLIHRHGNSDALNRKGISWMSYVFEAQ